MFISDLAGRLAKRVQVSSDSLAVYADAMERGFGTEVDYGQISKTYAFENLNQNAVGRYSPAEVVKVERAIISGMPDVNRICTSHIGAANTEPARMMTPFLASKPFGSIKSNSTTNLCPSLNVQGHSLAASSQSRRTEFTGSVT
jgi:hypothetical protein